MDQQEEKNNSQMSMNDAFNSGTQSSTQEIEWFQTQARDYSYNEPSQSSMDQGGSQISSQLTSSQQEDQQLLQALNDYESSKN